MLVALVILGFTIRLSWDDVIDGYGYGARFIGMIESDALKIDIYRLFYEYNENMNV